MSICSKSFTLKCLKKTISSYPRPLIANIYTSSLRLNNSYLKIKHSPLFYTLNGASVINKNIRLYHTSPISWDDVDNIIANTQESKEEEPYDKKTKGTFI